MNAFLLGELASRLVETLLHFLWQGTLLALLYPTVLSFRLLRTSSSRYAFTLSLFLTMAACPWITFFYLDSITQTVGSASDFSQAVLMSVGSETHTGRNLLSSLGQPELLLFAWGLGVTYYSLRIILAWRESRRWRTEISALPSGLRHALREIRRRMGFSQFERIYLSAHAMEPIAIGFWKPTILLPISWASRLPVSTVEAVIAHELAHLQRYDLWVNLAQRIVEALLFYHPAIWWISACVREEREMCCDDLAARSTSEQLGYALALEEVASFLTGSAPLLGTPFLGDENMKLLSRVRHVLGQPSSAGRGQWWPAGMLALLLPVGIIGSSLTADENVGPENRPPAYEQSERPQPPGGEFEGRRPPGPPQEFRGQRPPGPPQFGQNGDRQGPPPRGKRGDFPPPNRDRGPSGNRDSESCPRPDGPPPRGEAFEDRPDVSELSEGDLREEVQRLREEVRRLHEHMRRQGPPPPRHGFDRQDGGREQGGRPPGPPPQFGQNGDRQGPPPQDGFGPPPRGFGNDQQQGPPPRGPRDRDRQGPPPRGGNGDRPERPQRPPAN